MRPERDSLSVYDLHEVYEARRKPRDPGIEREIRVAAGAVAFPLICLLAGALMGSGEFVAGVLVLLGGFALVWLSRWTK